MVEKKRENSGRYSRSVDDAEVLAAVRAHDPAATSEIAEEVGISRQGADRRLRVLRDSGDVSSKKIGASLVWFMPRDASTTPGNSPRADDTQTPRETVDTPSDPEDDESPSDPPPTPTQGEDSQPFAAVDFPAGKDREQCVEAINAAREFLQDEGAATMREIVSAVLPEHSLGYDVDAAVAKVEAGERYRGAWWRRVVKPGLEAADGVEKPARGASEWQYIGGR